MKLKNPIDIALIGTGFRSQTVYRSLFATSAGRPPCRSVRPGT